MPSELADVTDELARLTSAVQVLTETLTTQTELLRLLLEAASSDRSGEDTVSMLHVILERLDTLTEFLAQRGTTSAEDPPPRRRR
ncbi:hypothetical protein D3273_26510 [Lichenibacterium minor]|uniref:Uncharacterized protein n=1 Tax=Lichenibacterium minor TaxID=2316528 RepID=A0A4Q2U015_9HYPH|nr:hypothetical protein [Lichenibacterium minor]RYC28958.1 hypothetical protein D3273_26510 [Lichenibacterium minor]